MPLLLRVDLDEPSLRRGALEILAYVPGRPPRTAYLDLGLALAEGSALGMREGAASELPIRVLVDSERLPTNASRSEIRMDSELVQRVRARVPSAFAAALTALTGLVAQGEEGSAGLGIGVEVLERRRDVLEHTLGAIAADVARLARGGATLTIEETALLALPLLQDAVGRPLALAAIRGGTPEHPLLVYTGAEAAPVELGAWLEGVIWARGRSAERAIAALTQILRLCESLLQDHVQLSGRVATVLRSARWPTVQGALVALDLIPTLHVGKAAYAPYRAPEGKPSPYDAPAIHLPAGELGASRRRQPAHPAHPALRTTLAELGATQAEGEIEIHEEPRVAAARVDEAGVATPISLPLRSLAPSVDRLPP